MGLTIQTASGGTPFSLQVQDSSNDRWFDVAEGDLHGIPTARIVNTVIPGATGMAPDGAPVDEGLLVRVPGYIAGVGATPALRRASYRSQRAALRAQLVGAGTLVTLTATEPDLGLASAETATLTGQFQRIVEPRAPVGDEVNELVIEILCMSDPVGWTVT